MSKKKIIIGATTFLTLVGLANMDDNSDISNSNSKYISNNNYAESKKIQVCDGVKITTDCEVDGILYSIYKYYEEIPEQSHIETITTYTEEITGYCTLCRDGSWSPTCATGRGACSRHGGVSQYNAPVYSKVPHYEEKKVIDVEYVPEKWEKVVK